MFWLLVFAAVVMMSALMAGGFMMCLMIWESGKPR